MSTSTLNTVSRTFITAGKSIFTLQLPETYASEKGLKPHYTFRVNHKKAAPDSQWGDTYFVKLLVGPENTSDYAYLGILNPETGVVRTTAKSCVNGDNLIVRLLNRALALVWSDNIQPLVEAGFALHHEGRCGRCGRVLTVPESITSGIGPECAGKMGL